MYLEQWTKQVISATPEGLQEFGDDKFGEFNRKHIDEFQLARLNVTLKYVYERSAFYRGLFDSVNFHPSGLKKLSEISQLPFTVGSDLADSPYKLLCIHLSDIERIYSLDTGGTTGKPKRIFFSENDLDNISQYMGAAMKSVADQEKLNHSVYKVAILLPGGEKTSQAELLAKGIEKNGGIPIIIDIKSNYLDILKNIEHYSPQIVFGSVLRIWKLTQFNRNRINLAELGVKVLFLTSEYLPEAMREILTKTWHSSVYCHYGMTEMGFGGAIECHGHCGYHFNESGFIFEVIDPQTGQTLGLGEEGELVVTTLNRLAMPLIRYRTGDIGTMENNVCKCGSKYLYRLSTIKRRLPTTVKLTSSYIYPSMLADVLYGLPGVIDYQAYLHKDGNRENLSLKIEVLDPGSYHANNVIEKLLTIPSVEQEYKLGNIGKMAVEFVGEGGIIRTGRAKNMIIDLR